MDKNRIAFRSKYGLPDVLSIHEVEIPVPKENEVLIRVYAATVNRTDCHVLWGKPLFMRFFTGLFKPRLATTGSDFAGQIEVIGKSVTSFAVGDRVMGFGGVFGCGSHAQFLLFPADKGIITMPTNINYEEAAACIEGAYYAIWGVLQLNPKPGQKALLIGGTGAIGSATMQYLKNYEVNVTCVCPGEHEQLARSLGADRIIDYKKEDVLNDTEKYDFIFDSAGKISFGKCKSLLKENGVYGSSSGRLSNMYHALMTSKSKGKRVIFVPPKDIRAGLKKIKQLIEDGKFKPVIDRKYPLEQVADAFTYVASGQKLGNVVLTIK